MKRAITGLLLLSGLACPGSAALACGDKFLIVGRCVSYQRTHMAQHPGHVLILWSSNSRAAGVIRDVKLQDFLQQAGHRVNVMEESDNTAESIKSGNYDVVILDAADADRVKLGLIGTATRVLPVMFQATDAEADQVRQNYRHALRVRHGPIKRNQVLIALDNTMGRM